MEQYVAVIGEEHVLFSAHSDDLAIAMCMCILKDKPHDTAELSTQTGRFITTV